MKTVIVVNQDQMGSGDAELGRKILRTFFTKASAAFAELEAVVFYNSGVRCLAADSPHLQPLSTLEEHGVDLIACGTCVEAFALAELKVGEVGSMDQILAEIERAEKVFTL